MLLLLCGCLDIPAGKKAIPVTILPLQQISTTSATIHYQWHCDCASQKTYGAHIQSYYTHLRNESQIGPYIYISYVQKCIIIPPSAIFGRALVRAAGATFSMLISCRFTPQVLPGAPGWSSEPGSPSPQEPRAWEHTGKENPGAPSILINSSESRGGAASSMAHAHNAPHALGVH